MWLLPRAVTVPSSILLVPLHCPSWEIPCVVATQADPELVLLLSSTEQCQTSVSLELFMLAVISSDLWFGVSCSHQNEVSGGLSTAQLVCDLLRPWQCS